MIRILLILTLLLSACAPEMDIVPREDVKKVYNQDKAMMFFQGLVEREYDVNLDRLAEYTSPHVVWVEPTCPWGGPPLLYLESLDKCVYGVMFDCKNIYVGTMDEAPEDLRTHDTALVHEFGHCVLMTMQRMRFPPPGLPQDYGDGDHSDERFWALVKEARDYTRQRDW